MKKKLIDVNNTIVEVFSMIFFVVELARISDRFILGKWFGIFLALFMYGVYISTKKKE